MEIDSSQWPDIAIPKMITHYVIVFNQAALSSVMQNKHLFFN